MNQKMYSLKLQKKKKKAEINKAQKSIRRCN